MERESVAGFNREEADDFLERIDEVSKQVHDIIEGNVDVDQLNKDDKDKEEMNRRKKEIKEREAKHLLMQGRTGGGHQGGYHTYCKPCTTEFTIEGIDKCTKCGRDTITPEERMDELKDKVEEHKKKKRTKIERRAKWDNWKKTQAMFYSKTSTNYHKWDVFESSEDDEQETEPILPKNDPTFRAMEADFEVRGKKRRKDTKLANECKDKGNESLKRGLFKTANKHYTDAMEHRKDMMPVYTNRALARLKLEMWQDALDDCTRVLEYCEVFDDGYTKQAELNYKAFMRRAQALRGMKDFEFALKDLVEAEKLLPNEKDPERLRKLYNEDMELHQRIDKIMENSESLQGKEYIDFLLNYLQGKTHEDEIKQAPGKRLPKYCKHELKAEDVKKLTDTILKSGSDDLIFYFNAKDGFKVLVDSLDFSQEGLPLLTKLLVDNQKLREDFQRQHLYEALIDFLYKKNVNAEGKTLDNAVVTETLILLESGSMNEEVRGILSEKKKIKDLFLVVIRSINIDENRRLCSSLIQFVSNLCYGTGKFRRMLLTAEASPLEFIKTLTSILESVMKPNIFNENFNEKEEETKEQEAARLDNETQRVLLKQAMLSFVANLCAEAQLRVHISADMGGLLSKVYEVFVADTAMRPFDWVESITKELAVFVNASVETSAQTMLASKGVVTMCESLLSTVKPEKEKCELIVRILNLLGKVGRIEKGIQDIIASKDIIFKVLVYFNMDVPEFSKNSLIIFHLACRIPDFATICKDKHKFNLKVFDTYVTKSNSMFKEDISKNDWDHFSTVCISVSAFITVFPERLVDFQEMIAPLINVIGNKTAAVRKNGAVLLAKLAANEDNGKIYRAHHGPEVLMSLREQLVPQKK